MSRLKTFVTLMILALICLSNQSKNLKRKKMSPVKDAAPKENKEDKPRKLDINNKEELKAEIERIKRLNDFNPVPLSPWFDSQEKEEKVPLRKLQRNLAQIEMTEKTGIFDYTEQGSYLKSSYQYTFQSLSQYASNFIWYPYHFDYTYHIDETNETEAQDVTKSYPTGAMLKLDPSDLESKGFAKLISNATFNIEDSISIYDSDVAVLKITTFYEEFLRDLFYESDTFFEYFGTYLGRFNTFYTGYEEYEKAKKANPSKALFVYLDHEDLKKNILIDENGLLRFRYLIVPDHLLGADLLIYELFHKNGVDALITKYVNAGGKLIVTGKSGKLMEHLGFVTKGVYNPALLLSSNQEKRYSTFSGCESTKDATPETQSNFFKQAVCNNFESCKYVYAVSSYPMTSLGGYEVVVNYNKDDENLRMANAYDGLQRNLTDTEKKTLPLLIRKKISKGEVIIFNGNPSYNREYNSMLFNVILYAVSQPVLLKGNVKLMDSKGEEIQIPAGEEGLELDVSIKYFKLQKQSFTNFKLHFFLKKRIEYSDSETFDLPGCSLVGDSDIPAQISQSTKDALDLSTHYVCSYSDPEDLLVNEIKIKIRILDFTVTQQKYNILLVYPVIEYENLNGKDYIDIGGIRTTAITAAKLRCALNPDPSSFYPFPGVGTYVDNVIKIENKEDTEAYEVVYIGAIPMVSPITDGVDQSQVARTIQLYEQYYRKFGYKLNFEATNEYDKVDVKYLNNKDVIIVNDWDTPVKPDKLLRDDTYEKVNDTTNQINIKRISSGGLEVESVNDVVQQISFSTAADVFFMLATQRMTAFIDTTKKTGASIIYEGNIPTEWKNPNTIDDVAKKEFLFCRNDIYFYDNKNYLVPEGITHQHIFSLDKYPNPKVDPCVKDFGFAEPDKVVVGHYNENDGLKPNEYSNALFHYCDKTIIDPTSEADIKAKVPEAADFLRPIHYLIPVVDKDVKKPTDLYGFVADDGANGDFGHLPPYDSVKFIYALTYNLKIPADITRNGGKLIIRIKSNVTVNDVDDVTFSPDQIAFFKTEKSEDGKTVIGFFKRGLLSNEAYGKDSSIDVTFENLGADIPSIIADIEIQELKFDISNPENNYENYYSQKNLTDQVFERKAFFRLPALEIKTKLRRYYNDSEEANTTMFPYELLEPFTRYGVYIQELIGHRTIYAVSEAHHRKDPGLQSDSEGFSTISNLGISSIPFVEYVTTGTGLVIPSSLSTSRVEWKDMWNRTWSQPLRTVFPDVPPIPPPLKNFMMSTTFEITKKEKNGTITRLLDWPSDEPEVQIHTMAKLLNNYPKYFEITRCKANEIDFIPERWGRKHDRIFEQDEDYTKYQITEKNLSSPDGNYYFLKAGGLAKYGECFAVDGSIVAGQTLSTQDISDIKEVSVCADKTDPNEIKACEEKYSKHPHLIKRSKTADQDIDWNYSPRVESYYPKGFIKGDMWDLTHVDYDDNAMDKAYKYHMDNNLPNIDQAQSKPSNTIMFPIYKGCGYDISYAQETVYHRNSKYHGWWSDNLQNKDDTLVAGQEQANDVSVDKDIKLDWIRTKDLIGHNEETTQVVKNIVAQSLRNIYCCRYNQYRVKQYIKRDGNYQLHNVLRNNIVPIIPDLDKEDPRLDSYDCQEDSFTPENIYKENNIVETLTDKDYLYFAANLRGGAKETINVISTLKPFADIHYEGTVKVNEGGRFVYWNPANGPNSYLIVDNPVNIVQAKQNLITLDARLFPTITTSYKSTLYHLYTIADTNKHFKEWPFSSYYMEHYGFGDSTVSVYVGGVESTTAVFEAGKYTYAKISFYNNAGFDWTMKYEAIDWVDKPLKPTSAQNILEKMTHTIRAPTAYNFMTVTVPDNLKDYITVTPSQHNCDVAPEFFDFGNINVVTIRDGFKGDYYYKVEVSKDLPLEFYGKPIEIKVALNPDYFNELPGINDPTKEKYHDYTLQIPDIKIAVPYPDTLDEKIAGKVFYTSAYATDLSLEFDVHEHYEITGFKMCEEETIGKLEEAIKNSENQTEMLRQVWEELPEGSITYTHDEPSNSKTHYYVNLNNEFDSLPIKNKFKPDKAIVYLLAQAYASQVGYGQMSVLLNSKVKYKDWSNKEKTALMTPSYRNVNVKGAWLQMEYVPTVLLDEEDEYIENPDQRVFKTQGGLVQVMLRIRNVGNERAYDTNYTLQLDENIKLQYYNKTTNATTGKTEDKRETITFYNPLPIETMEFSSSIIYVRFPAVESRPVEIQKRILATSDWLKLVRVTNASIDLTEKEGEVVVNQTYKTPCQLKYEDYIKELVALTMEASKGRNSPKVHLTARANKLITETGLPIKFGFYKKNIGTNKQSEVEWQEIKISSENEITENLKKVNGTIKILYQVKLYDETKQLLASAKMMYDYDDVGLSTVEKVIVAVGTILIVLSCLLFAWAAKIFWDKRETDSDKILVKGRGVIKAPMIGMTYDPNKGGFVEMQGQEEEAGEGEE